ncbi:hypothetical protein GMRT_22697 [Giardia muris]|uniref:Uncharacterized protein n=1 Tax=Giardia muris TaxID=5742 RepID=A0A4Z1T931_GIAMU|nr:hypothetical protein GMRT_22697 [Giardia muris]|eukprot:TNJ29029.1 hypothetical protein GMRT_22697 [Giardia muris]
MISLDAVALLQERLRALRELVTGHRRKHLRAFQLLPRHRRRRIMSWSRRAYPSRFRARPHSMGLELGPPPRPSRKLRRARSLCRLRVFFSKRFHIHPVCGAIVPVSSQQKQLRYVERRIREDAVCFCDTQTRHALISSGSGSNSGSDFGAVIRNLPATCYVATLSRSEGDVNGVETRLILTYHRLDEPLILWEVRHHGITFISLETRATVSLLSSLPEAEAMGRFCAIFNRRVRGYMEHSDLDVTCRSLGPVASLRANVSEGMMPAPPRTSPRLFDVIFSLSMGGAPVQPCALHLAAFDAVRVTLLTPGLPPWKRPSRPALKLRTAAVPLDQLTDKEVQSLARDLEPFLKNDALRKQASLRYSSMAVDEGEPVDNETLDRQEPSSPATVPRHVDMYSLDRLESIPSTGCVALYHGCTSLMGFEAMSLSLPPASAAVLLRGFLKDGIPVLGEEELRVAQCPLTLSPVVPTIISPALLVYDMDSVLKELRAWLGRPWQKREHRFERRSLLSSLLPLSLDSELKRRCEDSFIARDFDPRIATVSEALYTRYFVLGRRQKAKERHAFERWCFTDAIDLIDEAKQELSEDQQDLTITGSQITRIIDELTSLVEEAPKRLEDAGELLRMLNQQLEIRRYTVLHRYRRGTLVELLALDITSQGLILHSQYGTYLGRCIVCVLVPRTFPTGPIRFSNEPFEAWPYGVHSKSPEKD